MKVVMVAPNDPAGACIKFVNALNRHTSVRARLITNEIRYNFMFEKDIHVPFLEEFDEVAHLLQTADVIHFHMWADENTMLGPLRVGEFIRGKTVVHHHHGEPVFRADPRKFAARETELGRRAIVSTPDLWMMYPEAEWIPNAVPLHDPLYLPYERQDGMVNGRVFVSHSPTRRDLKNTAEFLWAAEVLRGEFELFDPVVIENAAHKECLRLKRRSAIFFDHMQGYYGVSSLEALSQGVVTIAGLDEWNADCVKRFTGATWLPWVVARTRDELLDTLRYLLADANERTRKSKQSRAWMEKYWREEFMARKLAKFYEDIH